jgi:hypothetical protein
MTSTNSKNKKIESFKTQMPRGLDDYQMTRGQFSPTPSVPIT